jgi:hypothetical protein
MIADGYVDGQEDRAVDLKIDMTTQWGSNTLVVIAAAGCRR